MISIGCGFINNLSDLKVQNFELLWDKMIIKSQ